MKYIVIAGVVIIIVFLVALSFIPIGIEPLTEVYFENHTKLPVNIFLNRTYNYTFTVHNLEYRDMQYMYYASADFSNKSLPLEHGNFTLSNNQSITLVRSFKMLEHFDRAKISLVITKDNNETIDLHFWVDEIVPVRVTFEKSNSSNNKTN